MFGAKNCQYCLCTLDESSTVAGVRKEAVGRALAIRAHYQAHRQVGLCSTSWLAAAAAAATGGRVGGLLCSGGRVYRAL